MDLGLQNQQFLSILKHKKQKTKSIHFTLYFWANPFVNLNVKFGWEKGIFEENVFSNICSSHKNCIKKIPHNIEIWKKRKNWHVLLARPKLNASSLDQITYPNFNWPKQFLGQNIIFEQNISNTCFTNHTVGFVTIENNLVFT